MYFWRNLFNFSNIQRPSFFYLILSHYYNSNHGIVGVFVAKKQKEYCCLMTNVYGAVHFAFSWSFWHQNVDKVLKICLPYPCPVTWGSKKHFQALAMKSWKANKRSIVKLQLDIKMGEYEGIFFISCKSSKFDKIMCRSFHCSFVFLSHSFPCFIL